MAFRIIVAVAALLIVDAANLRTAEYANLRMVLANTTKALKEAKAADQLEKVVANATKAAKVVANATKAAKVVAKPAEAAKPVEKAASKSPFPKHASKVQQAMIVKQLTAEEDKLSINLKSIKALQKEDRSESSNSKKLESMMKGKDKEMFAGFDAFSKRANEKAAIGAQDVLSKLKHIVHFIKKGALSGNQKSADGLDDVLKAMTGMVR